MTFPKDAKIGDVFRMSGEPVRITNWNYSVKDDSDDRKYFDIEFLDITRDGEPAASMILIPMDFDFYETEIVRVTPLEVELF